MKKRRRLRYDRIALFIVVPAAVIIAAVSCGTAKLKNSAAEKNTENATELESTIEDTETQPPQDKIVNIVAAGDNLVQTKVYEAARQHAEGSEEYNFSFCYENAADLITSGDLNIINQETPICNDEYEISGSNFNFNSPAALGDQLIEMGVNVFSVCNNHILDKGTDGLRAQLDYWDKKQSESGVISYGVYRNQADMDNIRIVEVNGAKIALLAYTEHLNGYSISDDSEICVTYTSETEKIESQIKKAKQAADAVIVSSHWGDEDTFTVRDSVKELAADMIEWGADVIIGTHSHTGETMEYIDRSDGSRGFVFYSLGNFISAQTDNFNLVGETADFNIVVSPDGTVSVEDIKVIPVITQYDDGSLSNIRVYPYYRYTKELAAQHGIIYTTSGTYRDWSLDTINGFIDQNIPKEFQCLTDPLS